MKMPFELKTTGNLALRMLAWLILAAMVAGCFPGQFPSPAPRNAPPVQTNGNTNATKHFYGGPAPVVYDGGPGG